MDLTTCSSHREASKRLKLHFVEEWQRRWDRAGEGRNTYAFIPNVRRRLKCTWLAADNWTMQFLIGHGDFESYLHKRPLLDSPLCECGRMDTPWHVIIECHIYDRIRQDLRAAVTTARQKCHLRWIRSCIKKYFPPSRTSAEVLYT